MSGATLVEGTSAKNTNNLATYYFTLGALNPSVLVRGGTYTDTLTVEAFGGTFASHTALLEVSNPLAINITVNKVASISLVDTGGAYNVSSTAKLLDFATLTDGDQLGFDVIVVSNAGYSLSAYSSNNKFLQRQGSTASASTTIAYAFYANNNLININTLPTTLSTGVGVTPVDGTRIPITITIPSITAGGEKIAGTYVDYITFTVATTE